jgi:hypothetical protein
MTRRDFTKTILLAFGSQLGLKAITDSEIVRRVGFEPKDTIHLSLTYEAAAPIRLRIFVSLADGTTWEQFMTLPRQQQPIRGPLRPLTISAPVPFTPDEVLTYSMWIEADPVYGHVVSEFKSLNYSGLGLVGTDGRTLSKNSLVLFGMQLQKEFAAWI